MVIVTSMFLIAGWNVVIMILVLWRLKLQCVVVIVAMSLR